MKVRKNLQELLEEMKLNPDFFEQIVHWKTLEAREAQYASLPDDLHSSLRNSLQMRGINELYTHQKLAYDLVNNNKSIVTVTPTASGKTLCYNLPVLQTIIKDPNTRALYMFPTKALAQDQKTELNEMK